MDTANNAAFAAPASPMANVATGTPLGIWTIECSESTPFRYLLDTGTPSTGTVVLAASMPGKCAAPPAPAMIAASPRERGLAAIIAGAGGAAHLPGMLAAKTTVPVLGVPAVSKYLKGVDSLHSIVQMPKGVPVATFAIGEAGAANAALFAVSILAVTQPAYAEKLAAFRARQKEAAEGMVLPPL